MKKIALILFIFSQPVLAQIGLYPQQNTSRNTVTLSGIWRFKVDSLNKGEEQSWFNGLQNTREIAVPGSWNEQFEDLRDYLGNAWYEYNAFVPSTWKGQKVCIRFGSATYAAKVWVNGKEMGTHEGGNLPFVFDITSNINWEQQNKIVVRVENILKPTRVPVGGLPPGGLFSSNPSANFDFFPYCGLQRTVWLYSTSPENIEDITIKTPDLKGMWVTVKKAGSANNVKIAVTGNGTSIEKSLVLKNDIDSLRIDIPNARIWDTNDPFLYTVSVSLWKNNKKIDEYHQTAGIRTIRATNKQILLNDKPVFLKGFGKHEDFPIFGRGMAYPVMAKDYSLLKWVGANSFRTSHYPYDEEYMQMADRQGMLIIDEIPAVGLYFDDNLDQVEQRRKMCVQQIQELISRDKNHPSVIMWCLANEPFPKNFNFSSGKKPKTDEVSTNFFKSLFATAKQADNTRLTAIVGVQGGPDEWLMLSDVICINRYYGWYSQIGDIAAGAKKLTEELDQLHKDTNKPVMLTEFGADTYPGMHASQPEMFTEEYQRDFIKAYLDVFDTKDFVCGAHIWAFSDFKTGQGIMRFGGMNWKGVFTRDRRPKLAAHYLRSRWNKAN